jgi:NTP pyrophosphatase (non-canonical NTP hydrolase)
MQETMQSTHSYEKLQYKVIQWACARQIIQNSTSTSQLLKAIAEMGELVDAHAKKDAPGVIDGLGDVLVCLINYAGILGVDLIDCLASAYDEIKDRKGYLTPEGTFVKE